MPEAALVHLRYRLFMTLPNEVQSYKLCVNISLKTDALEDGAYEHMLFFVLS